MDAKIITDAAFLADSELVKNNAPLAHFKLVYITQAARQNLNFDAAALNNKVLQAPSYYIFSSNLKDLRAAMHNFVDRMFDTVEKSHESK
jgi:hypothetical protein